MRQATRDQVSDVLSRFGVEIAPGSIVVISDVAKAEGGYIHHSTMPVAVVVFALALPSFARGRFPKVRLVDVVGKRPSMDEKEAVALAALCGRDIEGRTQVEAFVAQLHHVIAGSPQRLAPLGRSTCATIFRLGDGSSVKALADHWRLEINLYYLRFQYPFRMGYVQGFDKSGNALYIGIGRCSPL